MHILGIAWQAQRQSYLALDPLINSLLRLLFPSPVITLCFMVKVAEFILWDLSTSIRYRVPSSAWLVPLEDKYRLLLSRAQNASADLHLRDLQSSISLPGRVQELTNHTTSTCTSHRHVVLRCISFVALFNPSLEVEPHHLGNMVLRHWTGNCKDNYYPLSLNRKHKGSLAINLVNKTHCFCINLYQVFTLVSRLSFLIATCPQTSSASRSCFTA
jgi:hypothetical protein